MSELCDDHQQLARILRAVHEICDRHNDVATTSLNERAFRNQNSAARRQLPGLRHSARGFDRRYLEVARHSSKPAQS